MHIFYYINVGIFFFFSKGGLCFLIWGKKGKTKKENSLKYL